ncbi:hypothetical protein RhiJN_16145 [Ceratobasidium sp. AG-Ba]|nr:hypothetical protein RhiJN_16145 [Ceratobasidium sp. AG-Ba]
MRSLVVALASLAPLAHVIAGAVSWGTEGATPVRRANVPKGSLAPVCNPPADFIFKITTDRGAQHLAAVTLGLTARRSVWPPARFGGTPAPPKAAQALAGSPKREYDSTTPKAAQTTRARRDWVE